MPVSLDGPVNSILTAMNAEIDAKSGAPTLTFGAPVSQSEGNAGTTAFVHSFLINRNGATGTLTVYWNVVPTGTSPVSASDFAGGVLPSGSVDVPSGQTGGSITVPVAGDTTQESDETYQLVAVVGPKVITTGTILNDDGTGMTPFPTGMYEMWDASRLDGANPNSLADGAAVASWTGTVHGIAFTQTDATKQPTLSANGMSTGKPTVHFPNQHWLSSLRSGAASGLGAVIDSQTHTTIVVMKNISANNYGGCAFGAFDGGDGYSILADGANVGRYAGGNVQMAVPYTSTDAICIAVTSTTDTSGGSGGGLQRVYASGGVIAANISPVPKTTNDFTMGACRPTDGAISFAGDIAYIFVYDRELTPSELLQVEHAWRDRQSLLYPTDPSNYAQGAPREFLAFLGDSQTMGVGTDPQGVNNNHGSLAAATYPYQIAQRRGLKLGQWSNLGIGGIATHLSSRSDQMQERLAKDVFGTASQLNFAPKYVFGEWANSWNSGVPGTTGAGYAVTYMNALKNESPSSKIAFWTSFSRAAEQTAYAERTNYDSYFDNAQNRATAGIDAYYAVHTDVHIGVPGSCPSSDPFLPYYSDGIHLTGYANYPSTPSGYPYFADQFQQALVAANF